MPDSLRLGVNIDHVATVRNARGGEHPCPVRAALIAQEAGANGITAHLREDRRHIKDHDIERLKNEVPLPLNLEMAATEEMLSIALKVKPHAVCLVPEKREELTTEGGLDAACMQDKLKPFIQKLNDANIRTALFIEPDADQLHAAKELGVHAVELHTGTYCHLLGDARDKEYMRLSEAAMLARSLELHVHAGHGLDYDNVGLIAAIPEIEELNIGHFLMGEAMFVGMKDAVAKMKRVITRERKAVKNITPDDDERKHAS